MVFRVRVEMCWTWFVFAYCAAHTSTHPHNDAEYLVCTPHSVLGFRVGCFMKQYYNRKCLFTEESFAHEMFGVLCAWRKIQNLIEKRRRRRWRSPTLRSHAINEVYNYGGNDKTTSASFSLHCNFTIIFQCTSPRFGSLGLYMHYAYWIRIRSSVRSPRATYKSSHFYFYEHEHDYLFVMWRMRQRHGTQCARHKLPTRIDAE